MGKQLGKGRFWILCGIWLGLGAVGASPASKPAATESHPLAAHPVVALTFDDLPAAGGLPHGVSRTAIATLLSDELRSHGIRGVYGFVVGSDVDDDADTQQALRVWVDAGMNLGNHTWSHPELDAVSAEEYEKEIAMVEPALRKYSRGRNWRWFRFPYLEEGNTVEKRQTVRNWLHEHDYRIAEVTLNFNDDDWGDPYVRCEEKHDEAGIAWLKKSYMESAANLIRAGREEQYAAYGHEIPNVLLLHETAFTTLMLPDLLRLLDEQGFRYAPLPKVEKNKAYRLNPNIGLPGGGSLTNQVLTARHLPWPAFTPEPEEELDRVCR